MVERLVYRMPKAGSIKNLQLQGEKISNPGVDEVCVQVQAIGLNFADIFAMQGLYKATPPGSFIPGLEFSGEIIDIGTNITNWNIGDRVMGATKFGGYVSHINIDHQYVIPLPSDWSYEQGAGFLVQGLTAYYALTSLGNLQKGMNVLIHSAAGGVGILANRICKKYEAYTIGTVGNLKKEDFLRKEEAYDEIIVRDSGFYEKLQTALNGRPLHLVMECIGGKILQQSWKAMAPMGRMIAYGSASFTSHSSAPDYFTLIWKYLKRPKIDPLRLPSQNKSLMGFNLIFLYDQTELMLRLLNNLMALDIEPQYIGQVFDFKELPKAIHLFQKGQTIGKVVVKL